MRAAGAGVKGLVTLAMGRAGRRQHIAARAITRVNVSPVPQLFPRGEINLAPLALHIRRMRSAQIRPFIPAQTKPVEILHDRRAKFRSATLRIEVFDPEHQVTTRGAGAFLRPPESDRMPDVQVASRRRSDATAVAHCRFQNADFRLLSSLAFNRRVESAISNHQSEMPKRLLLWDIDATLITTAGAGDKALKQIVARRFGVEDDLHDIEIAGRTDVSIVRSILRKYGIALTEENVRSFLDEYLAAAGEKSAATRRTHPARRGGNHRAHAWQARPRPRIAHRQSSPRRTLEAATLRPLGLLRVRRVCRRSPRSQRARRLRPPARAGETRP